jgi:hypothetical protein
VSGRTLLRLPVRKTHPAESIVPVRSYRAVKLPSAHYLLVDCLLFGLSAASNKRNSMRCPESPPTCVWSPTQICRALLFARACGLVPRRASSLAGCHRAAGACQGAAHVRDEGSRRHGAYMKV